MLRAISKEVPKEEPDTRWLRLCDLGGGNDLKIEKNSETPTLSRRLRSVDGRAGGGS